MRMIGPTSGCAMSNGCLASRERTRAPPWTRRASNSSGEERRASTPGVALLSGSREASDRCSPGWTRSGRPGSRAAGGRSRRGWQRPGVDAALGPCRERTPASSNVAEGAKLLEELWIEPGGEPALDVVAGAQHAIGVACLGKCLACSLDGLRHGLGDVVMLQRVAAQVEEVLLLRGQRGVGFHLSEGDR